MATSLIQTLNDNAHLTPDEIVRKITDPFGVWRPCSSLTRDEYYDNRETRIVICNRSYCDAPEGHVEMRHKIGTEGSDYEYHRWDWDNWCNGVLSHSSWWFRSFDSYESNPQEPFNGYPD